MAEESEGLTQENAWLRAYLETLVYHEETFRKLEELQIWVWHLTQAIEAMNDDMQVLLARSRGQGLYGGDARDQAEALSQTRKQKTFKGIELEQA